MSQSTEPTDDPMRKGTPEHRSWRSRKWQAWKQIGLNNKLILFLTCVIAGSNVFYIVYARRQWQAMSGQVTAMQSQLGEMQEQNRLAQQQLEGTMAAVIDEDFELQYADSTLLFITINLINDGHVTARQVQGTVEWQMIGLPSQTRVGVPQQYDVAPFDIPFAQNSNQHPVQYRVALSPKESVAISHAQLSVMASASLTYLDGFGRTRALKSCKALLFLRADNTSQGLLENSSVDCRNLAAEYRSLQQRVASYKQQQHKKPT